MHVSVSLMQADTPKCHTVSPAPVGSLAQGQGDVNTYNARSVTLPPYFAVVVAGSSTMSSKYQRPKVLAS